MKTTSISQPDIKMQTEQEAKDIEAISTLLGKASKLMDDGDFEPLGECYTDDLTLMSDGGIIRGKEEYLDLMKERTGSSSVKRDKWMVCGSLGVEMGSFSYTEEGSEKQEGKWM